MCLNGSLRLLVCRYVLQHRCVRLCVCLREERIWEIVYSGLDWRVYISIGPDIRQDYPLNLSILLSGGKETNKDSPSNGE